MLSDFLIRLRTLFRRKTVENELRDPAYPSDWELDDYYEDNYGKPPSGGRPPAYAGETRSLFSLEMDGPNQSHEGGGYFEDGAIVTVRITGTSGSVEDWNITPNRPRYLLHRLLPIGSNFAHHLVATTSKKWPSTSMLMDLRAPSRWAAMNPTRANSVKKAALIDFFQWARPARQLGTNEHGQQFFIPKVFLAHAIYLPAAQVMLICAEKPLHGACKQQVVAYCRSSCNPNTLSGDSTPRCNVAEAAASSGSPLGPPSSVSASE
jgi:hypothetical protein